MTVLLWKASGKRYRNFSKIDEQLSLNGVAFSPMTISISDVHAAQQRIAEHIVATPLLRSERLDELCGGRVVLKCETLQRTGSFKIRGALNRIMQLTCAERRLGVVAWSSGNHAQGVAAAARAFNVAAVIVMPADAPQLKMDNTKALGAEVITYDRATENRETIARKIAAERGSVVVPSYDDPAIIAGQGTAGLEMVAQTEAMGLALDNVFVPASGGGLMAGVALAVHNRWPDARLYACEPEGYDDHRKSVIQQARVSNVSTANALCDALLAATPGELTWTINKQHLSGGCAVTDDEVCRAMAFAFTHLKLVVEPGGAVALAAILSGRADIQGRTAGVILSGGNVDRATFAACLARAQ
jgi:threonine dehydratase